VGGHSVDKNIMRTNKFILTYFLAMTSFSILYSQDLKIDSLSFDKSGQIKWVTRNEKADTKFEVQERIWNRWITLAKIPGKGAGSYSYSFTADTSCGIYWVRINSGKFKSDSINYINPKKAKYSGGVAVDKIRLKQRIKFEVYDQYGKLLQSGCDSILNIKGYKKGMYYLNCGDKFTEFAIY
jgi:hypothetical protein